MIYVILSTLAGLFLIVLAYFIGKRTAYFKAVSHYKPFDPVGAYLPADQVFLGIRPASCEDLTLVIHEVVKATDSGCLESLDTGEVIYPFQFYCLVPLVDYVHAKYNVVENRALKEMNRVMSNLSDKLNGRKVVGQADIVEAMWVMRRTLRGSRFLPI